jgi:hypothetical protein
MHVISISGVSIAMLNVSTLVKFAFSEQDMQNLVRAHGSGPAKAKFKQEICPINAQN